VLHSFYIMHADMKQLIMISTSTLAILGILCGAATVLRAGMSFYPEYTFLLASLAGVLLVNSIVSALSKEKADKYQTWPLYPNHPLVKKSREYAQKLQLPADTQLYEDGLMFNAQAIPVSTPEARGGIIVIGRPLMNALDTEEINAILAHEFGHLKDLLPYHRKFMRVASVVYSPLMGASLTWLLSFLVKSVIGHRFSPEIDVLDWLLALSFTIKIASRATQSMEIYADNVAKELAGPLAISSSMRKFNLLAQLRDDKDQAQSREMNRILGYLGIDDLFSTHPGEIRRMKI
jgi:Zn-dependent protease with chaperone function